MTDFNFDNRQIAVKALVGSHNYNLDTIASDEDFKFFVVPNFDDLYAGKFFAKAEQSVTLDFDCHDIRQLVALIMKANLNFIEVLWSQRVQYDPALAELFYARDGLSMMNLPAFKNATYGMHLEKMAALTKGTAKTMWQVKKSGWDWKQGCHALRCLYVLENLAEGMTMGEALWFENGNAQRDVLLAVKAGEYTLDEFRSLVENWHNTQKEDTWKFYADKKPVEEVRGWAEWFIKEYVRKKMKE